MQTHSHLDIGQIGERAAAEYYKGLGYELVTRNYWKPFGEIDVVVRNNEQLVFVEVKSVSCVTFASDIEGWFNPADNVHHKKRSRLRKIIAAYLAEESGGEIEWHFDVAIVQVNLKLERSRVEIIEDVIL